MLRLIRSSLIFLLILAASLILLAPEALTAQSNPYFYYSEGVRIPLTLDPTHITVRFDPALGRDARRQAAIATGDVKPDAAIDVGTDDAQILELQPGRDSLTAIRDLRLEPGVRLAEPAYRFDDGGIYGETDEFIARFHPDLTPAAIDAFLRSMGAVVLREQPYSDGTLILRPAPGITRGARELANAFVESGRVEFAEPNFVIVQPRGVELQAAAPQWQAAPTPNDTYWDLQWSLENRGQFGGAEPGVDIRARDAWGISTGSTSVKIAIIDEGIYFWHQDLHDQLLQGINVEVDPNTTNTDPTGDDHHGTATAGIAAAETNNSTGIAGICQQCRIIPVKVAHEDAAHNWVTTTARLAAGIDWSWQIGADVLSNSWTMSAPSDDVKLAIVKAVTAGRNYRGSAVVFSAGNGDIGTVSFPASYSKYVIGVGATNWCDQRKTKAGGPCNNTDTTWGSNYGPKLTLVAPGMLLLTTCNGANCPYPPGGPYVYFSGTSAAAPLVAGVAGLLYSVNSNLTAGQVKNALVDGGVHLPATDPDTGSGYSRLDALGAISALYDLQVSITPGPGLAKPGDPINYTVTCRNVGLTPIDAIQSPQLRITLSSGLTLVSSDPTLTPGSGYYTFDPGSLARNASKSVNLTVQVGGGTEGRTLTLSADLSSNLPELLTTNNHAVDSVAVADHTFFLPFIFHQ